MYSSGRKIIALFRYDPFSWKDFVVVVIILYFAEYNICSFSKHGGGDIKNPKLLSTYCLFLYYIFSLV